MNNLAIRMTLLARPAQEMKHKIGWHHVTQPWPSSKMLATKSANIDAKKLEVGWIKLDEDHAATLEAKNDLASLYTRQSDFYKAERLLLEAIESRRLELGDTYPHTLKSWHNLIDLHEALIEPEEAKK